MFEKILEELTTKCHESYEIWSANKDDKYADGKNEGFIEALNIVQKVVKEYGNASDNDLAVVSALPSLYPLQPFEEEAIHKVVASAKDGGWILTEKELPSNGTYVYVTCHSHVDDGPDWVAQSFYFNDTWGIPLVDCGKAEVIAWKEEKTPAPYQKECVNVK